MHQAGLTGQRWSRCPRLWTQALATVANAPVQDELDYDEVNRLLSRVVRGSKRVERSTDEWRIPIGMSFFAGPGEPTEAELSP